MTNPVDPAVNDGPRHTNLPTPEEAKQPPGQLKKMVFTPENEDYILKIVATDLNFAIKWARCLYPDHWVNPYNQLLFRCIRDFYLKDGRLPATQSIAQLIKSVSSLQDPVPEIIAHWVKVSTLKDTDSDKEFLKKILLDHIRSQDYQNFAYKVAMNVRDGKYEEIPKQLGEMVGRHRDTTVVEEYTKKTIAARVAEENAGAPAIPTQYPTFNANNGGGYEAGGVYIYMGPSGSGKSILLCNDGCHFLKNGKTVYHFTFELSAQLTKARYDVCLTGKTHEDRKNNPNSLDAAIVQLSTVHPLGKLFVIEYPTGTCDMNQVRGAIEDHRLITGTTPDAVILDYLTIMRPNDTSSVDMKSNYDKQKVIAEEVRALAMMMKIPIISAVQSNRGSVSKDVIHKDDIADSWGVIHVVDGVLTICQHDVERAAGKMRLYNAKSRNRTDSYTIVCNVDYSRLQINESVVESANYNSSINSHRQNNVTMVKNAAANPGPGAVIPAPKDIDPNSFEATTLLRLGGVGQKHFAGPNLPVPPPPIPNAATVSPVAVPPAHAEGPPAVVSPPPQAMEYPALPAPIPLTPDLNNLGGG